MSCPSKELNKLLPELLPSPERSQGQTWPSRVSSDPRPPPNLFSMPHSQFLPKPLPGRLCQTVLGLAGCTRWGPINHNVGRAAALAENKEDYIDRSVHSINTSTQKRSPR